MRAMKGMVAAALVASMLFTGCGGTTTEEASTDSTTTEAVSSEETTADAETAADEDVQATTSTGVEVSIPFHLASKEEGLELFLGNEEYFKEFNENKIEYALQKKGATIDEYFEFAKEQVIDWTDEEKALITQGMNELEDIFKENGWKLPPLDEIVFIRTTMAEENNVTGYTHGTQVYLGDVKETFFVPGTYEEGELPATFKYLLAHELFHCLTRCNPDFRASMYNIIGFTVADDDFELPPSVWEYYIANPDVEHHDAWATFTIDGNPIDCFCAFVTTRHFEKEGDRFFDLGTTALVPIDGSDVYYTRDQASDFFEVFGDNTPYVIDPEECMADNFGFAVVFGDDGPSGDGYNSPEIIEKVYEVLSK